MLRTPPPTEQSDGGFQHRTRSNTAPVAWKAPFRWQRGCKIMIFIILNSVAWSVQMVDVPCILTLTRISPAARGISMCRGAVNRQPGYRARNLQRWNKEQSSTGGFKSFVSRPDQLMIFMIFLILSHLVLSGGQRSLYSSSHQHIPRSPRLIEIIFRGVHSLLALGF